MPVIATGTCVVEPIETVASIALDKEGTRRFIIQAPASVTIEELERITKWLELQLYVSDKV